MEVFLISIVLFITIIVLSNVYDYMKEINDNMD